MSVIWQLPKDILHSIYSEWLGWKDLSSLDRACVEKNIREEWLSSLSDLRMLKGAFWSYTKVKVRILYKWLESRKVFWVEDFPIKVDVLEDLVTVLDMEYYCPLLRSIKIDTCSINEHISDISQGVTVWMSDFDSDIVLSVLIEQLRENSLVSIFLLGYRGFKASNGMITDLLTKHACSLRAFNINIVNGEDMNFIVSTLIVNKICLRQLTTILGNMPSQEIPALISYLSSSGGWLENLEVISTHKPFNSEDLVASVATSCPKLTRLVTLRCNPCSIETLRQLYEQCPHLQDVSVDRVIQTDEKRKSISIDVKGHNEDWAICLSHALRKRQYEKVTLRLREDYNYRVENLKSMLEPYHIDLDPSITLETSLISLLQDLPHVNSLDLPPEVNYTYATLGAISEHANSLTELKLSSINFPDKQLSKLFKTCQLLKKLTVVYCGLVSLVAISKLSNLNIVSISMNRCVSVKLLERLLLDENVTWPSTLKEGYIIAYRCEIPYLFNNESHQWIR
eukprot:scaffold9354_cov192-Ochromonas_danica.AAC.4